MESDCTLLLCSRCSHESPFSALHSPMGYELASFSGAGNKRRSYMKGLSMRRLKEKLQSLETRKRKQYNRIRAVLADFPLDNFVIGQSAGLEWIPASEVRPADSDQGIWHCCHLSLLYLTYPSMA
ncbi:hypothetical protein MA16_Dca006929 [Dendrobium catenatum]|uniref:Uncharacterized protein n=1 Tax=Dendrobium catenatum TaxID=906689 RepID=A0A2I0VWV4_9ASPA|nr:hypothetical protein MA16_Dca006929 [Dendrobium catenatum]